MMWPTFLIMLTLAPHGADAQELQTRLASARDLYASAEYEEALATLGNSDAVEPEVAVEVERYRALCFFALGKSDSARAAVTKLVERHPLYVPSEADVPPRLLRMLHEVRREVLPAMVRRAYADIRPGLASKAAAAAATLERIVLIASDPDVKDVEGMEDLRLLADGFLTLAKATTVAKAPGATATIGSSPPPTAAATSGSMSSTVANASRPIFTGADGDVVPPEPLDQTMPVFSGTRATRSGLTFTGYVRVTIDEAGRVESVGLLREIHPAYDPDLLRAAANWKFKPAQKDGAPVRYLKVIKVIVKDK